MPFVARSSSSKQGSPLRHLFQGFDGIAVLLFFGTLPACSYTQDEKLCDSGRNDELSLALISQGRDLSGWWIEPDHGNEGTIRLALFVSADQKPRWLGDLRNRPSGGSDFSSQWQNELLRFGCALAEDKPLIVGAKNVSQGRRPWIQTGWFPVPTPLPMRTMLVDAQHRSEQLYLQYSVGEVLFDSDPPTVTYTVVFGYRPDLDKVRLKPGSAPERMLEREKVPGS